MNDAMDIENLNLSISNILSGYEGDKCSLSEQEMREVQDELFEFVPIEDAFDDDEGEELDDEDEEDEEEEENDEDENDNKDQDDGEDGEVGEGKYEDQNQNEDFYKKIQNENNEESVQGLNYIKYGLDQNISSNNFDFSDCDGQNNVIQKNSCFEGKYLMSNSIDSIDDCNSRIISQGSQSFNHRLSTSTLNTHSGKKISSFLSSNEQIALVKKKKISKPQKKGKALSQIKVSYVDIYKRKEINQKCRMKLKVPYAMQSVKESYFLLGDVVIEMNFSSINNSDYQNCILNMYKPVQKVVYNNKTRCLSMFQASNNEFLVDFNFLSKQLIEYPDQNIHLVGRLIEKYQDIVKLLHLQIKNVRTLSGFSPELIAQRRAYFDEQVNTFLEKIDEHQMYFIQKFHTNYQNASFEANEVGYSRQFLALLGTDEQTITNIILRSGKPELYNFESRLKMMLVRMLSIVQGKFKGAQSDFEIYTFDNIRVFAKLKILPVCIEYPPHLKLPFDNYNEINCMAFGLIDVDPNMVQQVITLRKQDKYHSHLKSIVQELNYTKQSEVFLEKYYEKSRSKYIKDRQNLQQRKQITKDNEQILMNHQQKQIQYTHEHNSAAAAAATHSPQHRDGLSQIGNDDKPLDNSDFFQQDIFGQSFCDENNSFKYVQAHRIHDEVVVNESFYGNNIESDLIKYNHFDYIDENYISQDVSLSRGEEGLVSLIEQYPQPCLPSNNPLNSQFISPATNLKNVFAKSQRVIQFADQTNPSQSESIHFEFNLV